MITTFTYCIWNNGRWNNSSDASNYGLEMIWTTDQRDDCFTKPLSHKTTKSKIANDLS